MTNNEQPLRPIITKPFFDALTRETIQLHIMWQQYHELFDSDEAIGLMNRTSPRFFTIIQESLAHNIILGLARITEQDTRKCLTIYRLQKEVREESLRKKIQELIKDNEHHFAFCKVWRDKHLAHAHLEWSIQSEPFEKFLPPANREIVGNALNALVRILKVSEGCFESSSTENFWDIESIKVFDGAKKMLHILSEGEKAINATKGFKGVRLY